MFLSIQSDLLVKSAKVALFAIVLSQVVTALTVISVDGVEGYLHGWQKLVFVAGFVPIVLGVPISYYVYSRQKDVEVLNDKLKNLLRYDILTGLHSRGAFFIEAQRILQNCEAGEKDVAVFFLDIDHFKNINDKHGHAMGDEILRSLGSVVNGTLGRDEIAGRLGGEEFAIVIAGCTPIEAKKRARALCEEFAAETKTVNETTVNCTISIGIHVSKNIRDLDDLLLKADRQLYRAKNGGRNTIKIAARIAA